MCVCMWCVKNLRTKLKKKEARNKKRETVADGSSGRGRVDTVDGGSEGEETLPGTKKYFQPLAFNY